VLRASGIPPGRIACVHNWAGTAGVLPARPEPNGFRAEHGLGRAFVVLYSGDAGLGHTFAAVVDAAWLLRERQDVAFLFVGGGEMWPQLEAEAWRLGLENLRFMSYLPRERLAAAQAAADAALVTENPASSSAGKASRGGSVIATTTSGRGSRRRATAAPLVNLR
jgi:colanic acid biosynthesis glycosyl transferase WcaI